MHLKWKKPIYFFLLCFCFGLILPAASSINSSSKEPSPSLFLQNFESKPATAEEDGVPERGHFLLIYSYQGDPIDPYIGVTRNGETIGSLSSLSSASSETLVDVQLDKGDSIGFLAEYGLDSEFGYLHNSLASFVEGFWANQFSINFFLQDEDGNLVEYQGTMYITFYLIPPFNGFELLAEPSSIAPGESSNLSLQAIEAPGVPVIIPDVTRVGLQASTAGVRLGGVSLPEYGLSMVPGVTASYGQLTSTTLLYDASPDSSLLEGESETLSLLAYSSYDNNKNGATVVEVIVDEEEDDDIVLSVSSDKESVMPQKTGEGTSAGITVQALKKMDHEPVAGLPVLLTVNAVPNSGGHHHHEGRETGQIIQAEGVTDEEGVFTTTFTSSEIAGEEWIVASSSQASQKDSTKVKIKVPNLHPLETHQFYELIGSPDNHSGTNDPCRAPESLTSQHYSNHFGTSTLNSAIESIAVEFNQLHPDIRLRINDMSLEDGGLFDVNNKWTTTSGHKTHRVGRNADIGVSGIRTSGGCEWELDINVLEDIIHEITQSEPLNEGNHMHIYTK